MRGAIYTNSFCFNLLFICVVFRMNSNAVASQPIYPCPKCYVFYEDYRNLLEHLYWRHGTESFSCTECGLRQWLFAEHLCHVLPIYGVYDMDSIDEDKDVKARASPYCYCGEELDALMIGCDEPACRFQWYHFPCVGLKVPPEGRWFCAECTTKRTKEK